MSRVEGRASRTTQITAPPTRYNSPIEPIACNSSARRPKSSRIPLRSRASDSDTVTEGRADEEVPPPERHRGVQQDVALRIARAPDSPVTRLAEPSWSPASQR
jgi:hypothetical protein